MSIKLLGHVTEGSTYGIKWRFLKQDNSEPTITQMRWTLMDLDGNVINGRENVSAPAQAEVTIILSGDDLAMQDQANQIEVRVLSVQAHYDPEDGGDPLPYNEQAEFLIYNMTAVS